MYGAACCLPVFGLCSAARKQHAKSTSAAPKPLCSAKMALRQGLTGLLNKPLECLFFVHADCAPRRLPNRSAKCPSLAGQTSSAVQYTRNSGPPRAASGHLQPNPERQDGRPLHGANLPAARRPVGHFKFLTEPLARTPVTVTIETMWVTRLVPLEERLCTPPGREVAAVPVQGAR